MSSETEQVLCQVDVVRPGSGVWSRDRWIPCGKPVKAGETMCGKHAGQVKAAATRLANRDAQMRLRQEKALEEAHRTRVNMGYADELAKIGVHVISSSRGVLVTDPYLLVSIIRDAIEEQS